jgi:hypothetical protein
LFNNLTDSRIYVFQNGAWDIKGQFSQAMQDNDPVQWDMLSEGKFSLLLLAVSFHL